MYNRISIIGGSGTGKTTLTDALQIINKDKVIIFKKQKHLNKWLKEQNIKLNKKLH